MDLSDPKNFTLYYTRCNLPEHLYGTGLYCSWFHSQPANFFMGSSQAPNNLAEITLLISPGAKLPSLPCKESFSVCQLADVLTERYILVRGEICAFAHIHPGATLSSWSRHSAGRSYFYVNHVYAYCLLVLPFLSYASSRP
jgi:hypothetical protein